MSLTVEKAQELRRAAIMEHRRLNPRAHYDPVVPAYHAWKEWLDPTPALAYASVKMTPDACGTCGLPPALHEGWEERARLGDRYMGYDRYDLLMVIDELERRLADTGGET